MGRRGMAPMKAAGVVPHGEVQSRAAWHVAASRGGGDGEQNTDADITRSSHGGGAGGGGEGAGGGGGAGEGGGGGGQGFDMLYSGPGETPGKLKKMKRDLRFSAHFPMPASRERD